MGVDPELWILVHGGFDGAATWPMPFRWGTYIAYMKFLRDDLQKAVDRNLLLRHVPQVPQGMSIKEHRRWRTAARKLLKPLQEAFDKAIAAAYTAAPFEVITMVDGPASTLEKENGRAELLLRERHLILLLMLNGHWDDRIHNENPAAEADPTLYGGTSIVDVIFSEPNLEPYVVQEVQDLLEAGHG